MAFMGRLINFIAMHQCGPHAAALALQMGARRWSLHA